MTEIGEAQSSLASPQIAPAQKLSLSNMPGSTTFRAAFALFAAILVIAISQGLILLWPDQALVVLRIELFAVVGALGWCLSVRRQPEPVRELHELIKEIHCGNAAIDELDRIAGNFQPLVQSMKEVLRDLRHQKLALNETQEEIRQRVANRTNAMERTIQSLRHQATRDPLTGLYNRRMLDEFLPRLIQQSRERKVPMALLMIDIDYFKDLNDTLGHAAGDDMLRALGQLIHSTIREKDMGFRCGGDEFVVVLPECDAAGAQHKVDSLQSLVNGLTRTLKVARRPALSIGIACLSDIDSPTAECLMAHADRQLYAVKASRGDSMGLR